jgi:ribosomal protein S18 acetylase RimI-like enzyme
VKSPPFHIEQLSSSHERSSFRCGNDRIDQYFRQAVTQDIKRRYATCFVAIEKSSGRVAGFYTLSANDVPLTDVPSELAKKLPRYPSVPATLTGWMGRHVDFRGSGLGEALLFDAIKTVATAPIGSHALFVNAIDEKAAAFYKTYGFVSLADKPNTMYIPVLTALKLIERGTGE